MKIRIQFLLACTVFFLSLHYASCQDSNLFTFEISDVKIPTQEPYLQTAETIVRNTLGVFGDFEDFSHRTNDQSIFIGGNLPGLIQAIHTSYQSHYPLKLSVSDFIIAIGQGLSRHINNNPEAVRDIFVDFEGKETIAIRRDNFIMGEQNDWSTVFGDFADEIKKRVKADIYDVVIDDTSVATATSRIVSEITLMDALKDFFDYEVVSECGIPKITLEGSKEDWERLRQKVQDLNDINAGDKLDASWWLDHLTPVVNQICDDAITRNPNTTFWRNIYKFEDVGSGNPIVSGWINVFFPYVRARVSGKETYNRVTFPTKSLTTDQLPQEYCKVPFNWLYYGTKYPMNFFGGFLGAQFNLEDFTVQPTYFWVVGFEDQTQQGDGEEMF